MDSTLSPGATTSTSGPVVENGATALPGSIAPTVSTPGSAAGSAQQGQAETGTASPANTPPAAANTISITADISGNVLYKRMWRAVYAAVKQGKKISAPLGKSPLLPRAVVQMINAGEESGKLGEVLDEVSTFYSRELKLVIKSVTAMIEPLMIVIMGGMVGFIAMSIILPIFKLSQLVK